MHDKQSHSTGFNLPVGSLSQSLHGESPEYYTLADALEVVRSELLDNPLSRYPGVTRVLEGEGRITSAECDSELGGRDVQELRCCTNRHDEILRPVVQGASVQQHAGNVFTIKGKEDL